jgi:hypothetical protein
MERKSVLRPVTGAIPCVAAANFASRAFSEPAMLACPLSAGPTGKNGGELRQPLTRVAKPYELRAARSTRCEEWLRW